MAVVTVNVQGLWWFTCPFCLDAVVSVTLHELPFESHDKCVDSYRNSGVAARANAMSMILHAGFMTPAGHVDVYGYLASQVEWRGETTVTVSS